MKHLVYILALLLLICTGCKREPEQSVTKTYPFDEFTALTCNCPIKIAFCEKATEIVAVAPESVIKNFVFEYDGNGNLLITIDKLNRMYWEDSPYVILPIPEHLTNATFYSMIDFVCDTTLGMNNYLKTDSLTMQFSGAVNMSNFDIEADYLCITSYDYGTNIRLSGKVNDCKLELHSANYDAAKMSVNEYSCEFWDANASLLCEKMLHITSAHNSNIVYQGICEVKSENVYNSSINHY